MGRFENGDARRNAQRSPLLSLEFTTPQILFQNDSAIRHLQFRGVYTPYCLLNNNSKLWILELVEGPFANTASSVPMGIAALSLAQARLKFFGRGDVYECNHHPLNHVGERSVGLDSDHEPKPIRRVDLLF